MYLEICTRHLLYIFNFIICFLLLCLYYTFHVLLHHLSHLIALSLYQLNTNTNISFGRFNYSLQDKFNNVARNRKIVMQI